MEAFRASRGGYLARSDDTERELMAGLASDVAFMLGHPIDSMLEDREAAPVDPGDPLAAYEAELSGISVDDADSADAEQRVYETPIDDAFYRLMPDMSEDPEEARRLRSMTENGLAATKAEHLLVFWKSLTGENDDVWVANEDVAAWVAGANSIRLVLAARLNIVDDLVAEEIHAKAQELTGLDGRGKEREIDNSDDLLAVLYSMISWWQDSLLLAVNNKRLRG